MAMQIFARVECQKVLSNCCKTFPFSQILLKAFRHENNNLLLCSVRDFTVKPGQFLAPLLPTWHLCLLEGKCDCGSVFAREARETLPVGGKLRRKTPVHARGGWGVENLEKWGGGSFRVYDPRSIVSNCRWLVLGSNRRGRKLGIWARECFGVHVFFSWLGLCKQQHSLSRG